MRMNDGKEEEYVQEGKGWQPIWIIVTEPATQPYLTPAPLIQIPVGDTNARLPSFSSKTILEILALQLLFLVCSKIKSTGFTK